METWLPMIIHDHAGHHFVVVNEEGRAMTLQIIWESS